MKLTKKQEKAIKSLLTDLDELENKPRRLYHALEEFALAFEKEDSIPSIRYAQDIFYKEINKGEFFQDMFRALRKYKIDTWHWQIKNNIEIGDAQQRIDGAEEFADLLAREITESFR